MRLAAVLVGLALSLLVPATAGAARSEFFGIVQGPTLDGQDIVGTPGAQFKDGMDDARVRTNRFLLNWKWVQPDPGAFRWGAMDKLIGRLAFNGIRTLPALWGNPDWVFGGEARPPLDSTSSQNAWQNFLKAVVARYGPTGSYWATAYKQQYGQNATPLPIQSWQIWNEPNLKKFYVPYPSPQSYARLVRLSHGAIRSRDSKAQVVLAGMPGYGDVKAWDFLSTFYSQNSPTPIKNYFDVVSLHPYAADNAHVRLEIQKVREVMVNRADRATPLWLTEFAWGSDPPDQFGINKGALQDEHLRNTYNMILQNRTAWNVQRLFWYLWRDPRPAGGNSCSFCGSAGLLRYNRTKKAAYSVFRSFTAEAIRPQASIVGGPAQGSFTRDTTPTFSFTSNEVGSTFVCRIDAKRLQAMQLAIYDPGALKRRPRLLRQGDRRPRKREPDRVPVLHGRHSRPAGADDHRHRSQLAGQRQQPRGQGHGGGRHDREALQDGRLHRHPRGRALGGQLRLTGHHRLGPRQLDHGLPRPGGGRRGQPLGVLGPPQLRRGLDAVASADLVA